MDGDIAQHGGESGREMTRLWRTWRTVYEMLADRVRSSSWDPLPIEGFTFACDETLTFACNDQGYEVSDDELQISLEEFRAKYSDPMGYPEYAIPQAETCVAVCKCTSHHLD